MDAARCLTASQAALWAEAEQGADVAWRRVCLANYFCTGRSHLILGTIFIFIFIYICIYICICIDSYSNHSANTIIFLLEFYGVHRFGVYFGIRFDSVLYIYMYVCGVVVFLSPILILELEGLQLLPAKQLGESMTEYLRFAMITE
jgi:hypothetical protein